MSRGFLLASRLLLDCQGKIYAYTLGLLPLNYKFDLWYNTCALPCKLEREGNAVRNKKNTPLIVCM